MWFYDRSIIQLPALNMDELIYNLHEDDGVQIINRKGYTTYQFIRREPNLTIQGLHAQIYNAFFEGLIFCLTFLVGGRDVMVINVNRNGSYSVKTDSITVKID